MLYPQLHIISSTNRTPVFAHYHFTQHYFPSQPNPPLDCFGYSTAPALSHHPETRTFFLLSPPPRVSWVASCPIPANIRRGKQTIKAGFYTVPQPTNWQHSCLQQDQRTRTKTCALRMTNTTQQQECVGMASSHGKVSRLKPCH